MEFGNRIEITDKDGWRKEFFLQKRLIYIGNDSRNDIVLSAYRGTGVAPRHLQLVIAPGGSIQCSAVNLSAQEIAMGPNGERLLQPSSAIEVTDGESFHLGDFVLVFHLQEALAQPAIPVDGDLRAARAPSKANSASIGLRVSLSQVAIAPNSTIEGMIYVSNQGSMPGVQFRLGIDGFPADCYEIGPVPILFPGAEKGVPVHFYHPCRPDVLAGSRPVSFWADAADAYPGESAVLSRDIRILPFYSHKLRLLPVD